MTSYTNTLSEEESIFFGIVRNVKCMTTCQAEIILKKFLLCSPMQANRIISNLTDHKYMELVNDRKYLVAGTRKTKFQEKLNLKTIRALYICLDLMDKLDNLKYTHVPSDNANLVFLANNTFYKVMDISKNDIFKVAAMQQSYLDSLKSQKKETGNQAIIPYTTIFTIPKCENVDEIFTAFDSIHLSLPYLITYFTSDDMTIKPPYELFQEDTSETE